MIIKTLLDYLTENLEGIYVGMEAPEQLTDYVLIDQTGSAKTNHITTTTVAIQSYGASLYEAMLLNERVKGVMDGFLALDVVTRVQLNTDYNFTDTETKQYRWQAVYQITHY
jgi:hypothetical protein